MGNLFGKADQIAERHFERPRWGIRNFDSHVNLIKFD
jgi:hypothetical protein